jgi:hypothetical protein
VAQHCKHLSPVGAIEGLFVDLSGADAYQLVFNISSGQVVEVRSREKIVRHSIEAGFYLLKILRTNRYNFKSANCRLLIIKLFIWGRLVGFAPPSRQ